MKKGLLFVGIMVVTCLLSLTVNAQYPQDWLTDDFNDEDLTLANWDGAIGATGWGTEYSATEGRNGTGCIKVLNGLGGFWNTALGPWPANHKFKISCWVKSSGDNPSPLVFDLHGVNNAPNTPCNNSETNGSWDTCTVVPVTSEWQLQEAYFVTEERTEEIFNMTLWINKDGYSCMGWDNPEYTEGTVTLVEDFLLTDMGPVEEAEGEVFLEDDFNDGDLTLANWDGAIGATGWSTEYSDSEGRGGTGCVKILNGMGGFWNTALGPWPANHKFKISCWVKGSGDNPTPLAFDLHGVNNAPNTPCNNSETNGSWDTCTVVPVTSEWQLQEAYFVTEEREEDLFNITLWCNKDGYSCMGWDNPDYTEGTSTLVDEFLLIDLGEIASGVGIKEARQASKPLVYIAGNELRNVNGLVQVYDISGRLVLKSNAYNNKLDVASLQRGIYIVRSDNRASKVVK